MDNKSEEGDGEHTFSSSSSRDGFFHRLLLVVLILILITLLSFLPLLPSTFLVFLFLVLDGSPFFVEVVGGGFYGCFAHRDVFVLFGCVEGGGFGGVGVFAFGFLLFFLGFGGGGFEG